MIQSRGRFPHNTLVLPARNAARRFVPCRLNKRGRRDSWRPIVLRWRQRPRRSVNALAGRPAPAAKSLWFPQFHFHFATCLGDRTRIDRLTGFLHAARIHQRHALLDHPRPGERAVAPLLQSRLTFRPMCAIHLPNSSWRQFPASAAAQRITEGVGASTQREEQPQRVSRRQRMRQQSLQMHSLCAPTAGDHGPQRPQENKGLQFDLPEKLEWRRGLGTPAVTADKGRPLEQLEPFQEPRRLQENKRLHLRFERPEELVWRRGRQSPTAMAENGDQERAGASRGESLQSMPGQAETLAATPAIEGAAALQMTKLDPGLVDRLTDNVIRRVEQRIRIERQRRGL